MLRSSPLPLAAAVHSIAPARSLARMTLVALLSWAAAGTGLADAIKPAHRAHAHREASEIRQVFARLAAQAQVHLVLDASVQGFAPAYGATGIPRADLDILAAAAGLVVVETSIPGRGPSLVVVPASALPAQGTTRGGSQVALYAPRMAVPQDLLAALLRSPELGGPTDETAGDEAAPALPPAGPVHIELLPGARTLRMEGPGDRVGSLLERAAALDVPPGGCAADALLVDISPDLADQLEHEATARLCPGDSGPESILSFEGREPMLMTLIPWGPPGSGRDGATRVRQDLKMRLTREGVDLPVLTLHRERDGDIEHEQRCMALSAYPTVDARICLSLFESRHVHGGGGPPAIGAGLPRTLVVPDGALVLLVLAGPAPTKDLRWQGAVHERPLRRLGQQPCREPVAVPALLLWLHLERTASSADPLPHTP